MALERLPDPTTTVVGPGYAELNINSVNKTMREELNNGAVYTSQVAGSYWELEITYPDLLLSEANLIHTFLLNKRGRLTAFEVGTPRSANPSLGEISAILDGHIPAGQVGNTLTIYNWNRVSILSANSILSPGDFIKLGSGNKVYMVTSFSLSGGVVTLGIYPNLVTPTTNRLLNGTPELDENLEPKGDFLVTKDVTFKVKNNSDNINIPYTTTGYVPSFKLSLREALNV